MGDEHSGVRVVDTRTSASALSHYRILDFDPLAHPLRLLESGVREDRRAAVPPEDSLVHRVRRTTLHAGGDGAGGLARGAVSLLEPARPEPQAEVLPAVRDRTRSERHQELLHLLLQLGRDPGAELGSVGQSQELEVHVLEVSRHVAHRDQPTTTVPPEQELRVVVEVLGVPGTQDTHEVRVQVATQLHSQQSHVQL